MKFINPDIGLTLLKVAGTKHLSGAMLNAAQTMIPAKEIFAYKCSDHQAPKMLLSDGSSTGADQRAKAFAAHFFMSDPVRKTRYSIKPDTGFYEQVNIDQIAHGEYRWQCFEKPGFTDKLCFGWRRGTDNYILTFYIKDKKELPSTPLFEAFGNICMTVLIHHADILMQQNTPLEARIENAIKKHYPTLTKRETEICAMTLAGLSAERTANILEISPNTVLTYRQRAYQKLGVQKSNELLQKLYL